MSKPNRTIHKMNSTYMNKYDAQMELKRRRKKRLKQRLFIIGMAFMMMFGVLITYHLKQRTEYTRMKTEYENLTLEMNKLENQKKVLLEEIDLLNDEEYILDIARTNLFFSKEGEIIFKVKNEDDGRTY